MSRLKHTHVALAILVLACMVSRLLAPRVSPDEIIATALQRYIRQLQEQKIQEEAEAFRAAYAELARQYQGQVVAFHEGQVVDHDEDFVALHRRIRNRFGHTAVLLRRVGPEPERVLTFRSPRFEQGKL